MESYARLYLRCTELALACRIYDTPPEIDDRLGDLRLTRAILDQAVKAGIFARREHGPNHPITTEGFNGWSESVASLRSQVVPSGAGWAANNDRNQGLTTNRELGISIAIVPGDHKTGRAGMTPSTRSPRGVATADAVRANGTGYLFKQMEEDIAALINSRNDGLWLLLVHVNKAKQWVQSELSRPVSLSEGRRPNVWSERIILPDIDFGSAPHTSKIGNTPPTEKSPEIVIQVKRRG